MKTIRAKQAKVYFVYFVQRDQHRIISNFLGYCDVFVAAAVPITWLLHCTRLRMLLLSALALLVQTNFKHYLKSKMMIYNQEATEKLYC